MLRKPWLVLAALSLALGLVLCAVLFRAYRGGITIRIGDAPHPVLEPPSRNAGRGGAPLGLEEKGAYTNEELQRLLQQEGSALGLEDVARNNIQAEAQTRGFLGPRLGSPENRAQAEASIRQMARMRRSIESNKKPAVRLQGERVALLSQKDPGGMAIETEALPPPHPGPVAQPSPTSPPAAADAWSGLYGGTRVGTFTISDSKTWREVWRGVSATAAPPVNFSRQQVVAVFLGRRPTGGYRVEIAPPSPIDPTALIVSFREIAPPPGPTPPEGATAPYALRAIPRSDLPVRFEKTP
ncbi:MAG TPA: hypothetical protein DEB40_09025 [Elusimicrobia bacterium]|nr:hypothetical protein [Elusimicrobiota bacterium]HBT61870.1 hypothetical protein [Elusimicrobiota bacterium]